MSKQRIKKILDNYPEQLYQTHTWQDEELNRGIRGVERRRLISLHDVKDKRIVDLGCATGAESLWASEKGASRVTGFDASAENVRLFRSLTMSLQLAYKVWAYHFDLHFNPLHNLLFDTVFCFSLIHHIGYRKIWRDLPDVQVVYVEAGADFPLGLHWFEDDKFKAELLGYSPNNRLDTELKRPLYRLNRR